MIKETEIEAIAARTRGATSGDLMTYKKGGSHGILRGDGRIVAVMVDKEDDAELFSHAARDIIRLVNEVRALKHELAGRDANDEPIKPRNRIDGDLEVGDRLLWDTGTIKVAGVLMDESVSGIERLFFFGHKGAGKWYTEATIRHFCDRDMTPTPSALDTSAKEAKPEAPKPEQSALF